MSRKNLTSLLLVLFLPCVQAAFAGPDFRREVEGRSFTFTGPTQGSVSGFALAGEPVLVGNTKPEASKVLTVNGKAGGLRFLQVLDPGPAMEDWFLKAALQKRKGDRPAEKPVVLWYSVHYADGQTLEIPVRWNEAIDDWFRCGEVAQLLWANPVVLKTNDPVGCSKNVVWVMEWPNPRPNVEIQSVDARTGNTRWQDFGTAAIFAATAVPQQKGNCFFIEMAPRGNDSNPGTFEQPWETLSKADATLLPGDTVYLRGGYYAPNRTVCLRKSGSKGAPITYSAFPGETPVINGSYRELDRSDLKVLDDEYNTGLVTIDGAEYVRIRGLQVEQSRQEGFHMANCKHCSLEHNVVFRSFGCGIRMSENESSPAYANVLVRPIQNNMQPAPNGRSMMTWHPGHESLTSGRCTDFEYAFNEIYGSSKEGIDCKGPNHGGKLSYNYIQQTFSAGLYIDGWSDLLEDVEIFGNWLYQTNGLSVFSEGAAPVRNIRIHHNVVADNMGSGIGVGGALNSELRIWNNTSWGNSRLASHRPWEGSGIGIGGRGSLNGKTAPAGAQRTDGPWDIDIRNNLVAENAQTQMRTSPGTDFKAQDIRISYNLLYPFSDQPAYETKNPVVVLAGENVVKSNPDLMNPARGDFRLKAGSPAIDAGDPDPKFKDPDGSRNDIGAIPFGAVCAPQRILTGHVNQLYGKDRFTAIRFPENKCNGHADRSRHPSIWGYHGSPFGYDFRNIPSGDQAIAGVIWYISPLEYAEKPTIILLKGTGSETDETRAEGIPVGLQAGKLHFMESYHAADKGLAAGTVLFHYVVHFSDGSLAEIPVRWREDVDHWLQGENLKGVSEKVTPAYVERTINRRVPDSIANYKQTWVNPTPQKTISSIDVISDNTPEKDMGSASVFAITAERE